MDTPVLVAIQADGQIKEISEHEIPDYEKIKDFRVHARLINGKTLYRIWNGHMNQYASEATDDARKAMQNLIECMVSHHKENGGRNLSQSELDEYKDRIVKAAPCRVKWAGIFGYEPYFQPKHKELEQQWFAEGITIARTA